MSELNPCPFCKSRLERTINKYGHRLYKCKKCFAELYYDGSQCGATIIFPKEKEVSE